VQQFGARIVTADGTLDRQHLGAIAFSQPDARTWLEEQIHPYVRSRLEAFIAEHDETPVIALVIPLLFEAGMADLVDEIWTVTCTSAQQRQRLQQRDNLSNEQIEARIASQWPLAEKIERSDRVLDNSGSLDELVRQVMAALELLEGESTDIPSLQ
jgi:dephospho-CoA kinase